MNGCPTVIRSLTFFLLTTTVCVGQTVVQETKELTPNNLDFPVELKVEATEGKSVIWRASIPRDLRFRVYENGRAVVFNAQQKQKTIEIESQCLDWESKEWVVTTWIVHLGEQPKPDDDDDDEPSPQPDTIPEDEFDNIGRRVAQWAQGLKHNDKAAEIYNAVAQMLLQPEATIDQTTAVLIKRLEELPYDSYKPVWDQLNADLATRFDNIPRETLSRYYVAVAKGFKP